ncbi:hypothetical protein ACFSTE_17735 [Aquimarina hainanensis]|uniref:Uncharacterized protein n=1 Tax=Aquimarina hainanensis TaxID=1578017 RepID=A0ABW5NAU2_9FLAO|nr:hypothetical protein [Aquimarina sp. TRL1]QKX06821.1 hypothetical protein HN014_18500 [Aquimarina sp. TRL1]
MKSKKAVKLIDKILGDLERVGIITNTLIEDLKTLRPFAIEEEVPLVVKTLRLTYEHIEENDTFLIPIPDDDPIEEDELVSENNTTVETEVNPVESLQYLIALMKDLDNKMNIADLREYSKALRDFSN